MTAFTNEQKASAVATGVSSGLAPRLRKIYSPHELLIETLQSALRSIEQIPVEQAKLQELAEQASNETERDARMYQIDLVEWQLTRSSELARRRLDYLSQIKTESDVRNERDLCAANVSHWFEMYAWAVDPRPDTPLSVMPFALFEFQERFVEWLDTITFIKRESGVVEKSRDMGATETVLRWQLHKWLFSRNFNGLVLSANEDLVDSKKDPGTLFEKLRFQIRLLPRWQLPRDFSLDKDMPYMIISNSETESVISGDAPTPNVGRQKRATFVLRDEFAAWAHGGYPQHTALSRTSNSNCSVSSVQGKFNKFADLAHDGKTAKFEMDWREHPWRDERWFNALPYGYIGDAMTQEEIAQEVERNYEASQPGRVLKNVSEPHAFINFNEFLDGWERLGVPAKRFLDRNGRPIIPGNCNWGRVCDYGESARQENDTHIWAYSMMMRPSMAMPLNDTLFFFHSRPIEPVGASETEGFACYSKWESDLGVRNGRNWIKRPSVNDMSHEATDPKEVLLKKCGDNWLIPDLDFDKGRRKLVFHFEIIDKDKENPFRPELFGRCRIIFVALPAPDGSDEYFLARNERTGAHFVTPSQTQGGFKRLRAEIVSWHYPPEERGKPVPKMRPKPVFDDVITTVRYAVARWGVDAKPLSAAEAVEAAMPEELKIANLLKNSPTGKALSDSQQMARVMAEGEVREKLKIPFPHESWGRSRDSIQDDGY